jgi:hypothetical protein
MIAILPARHAQDAKEVGCLVDLRFEPPPALQIGRYAHLGGLEIAGLAGLEIPGFGCGGRRRDSGSLAIHLPSIFCRRLFRSAMMYLKSPTLLRQKLLIENLLDGVGALEREGRFGQSGFSAGGNSSDGIVASEILVQPPSQTRHLGEQ